MTIRRSTRRRVLLAVGGTLLVVVVAAVVLAPWIAPHGPDEADGDRRMERPSAAFPLGTDSQGRCVLSRLLHGGRTSLTIAALAVAIGCLVGAVSGAAASYAGKGTDLALATLVDLLASLPGLVLVVVAAGLIGTSSAGLVLVLAVLEWGTFARVARTLAFRERERLHVVAAQALGLPGSRVFRRHLLPGILGPVATLSLFEVGRVLVAVGGLGFLGFGPPPPQPEWGRMILEGRDYLRSAPWLALAPSAALVLTTLVLTVLGEGLRQERTRKGRLA